MQNKNLKMSNNKKEKMPRKKIMIIDDDKEFLEELKETLNLNGYEVAAFSDGTSAMEVVFKIKPNIILLDLKLKGKSGFQVAYELKSYPETAKIPIIAMSAYYAERVYTELMDMCGIQIFLIKPFNLQDAIARIEAVLKERGR